MTAFLYLTLVRNGDFGLNLPLPGLSFISTSQGGQTNDISA